MKPLKTLALAHPETSLAALQKQVVAFPEITLDITTDAEHALAQMGNGHYNLLLVDKNLPEADFKKLNRLSGMLFPDAAQVNLNMADEEFIAQKLHTLLANWQDAHTGGGHAFRDNPDAFKNR